MSLQQNGHWLSLESDMGSALTVQQQQSARADAGRVRCAWLSLAGLDAASVEQRLRLLLDNQQALRTGYGTPPGFTGLRQQVQPARLHWQLLTAASVTDGTEAVLQAEAEAVFAQQQPHLLGWFCPAGAGQPVSRLLLVGPALNLDDGTLLRLREALLGQRDAAAEPEMQYLDYASWISELQDDEDADEALAFWRGLQLATLPAAQFSERLGESSGEYSLLRMPLAQPLQAQLQQRAEQLAVAPEQIALVVWAALLQRLSGRSQFQLSWYHDCRDDYEELDDALGLFVQPLAVPFHALDSLDLQRAVTGLAPLLAEQLEYQEYVAQVATETQPSLAAGFNWRYQDQLTDLTTDGRCADNQLLLQLVATAQGEGELALSYDNGRYGKPAMQRLLARYPRLLAQALALPAQSLSGLDCALDDEAPQLFSLADSASPAAGAPGLDLIAQIRQQALLTPQAPALREGARLYSYAELDQLTEQAATALQQAGAGPETLVALCLPRGAEMLLALLAVLKTGAAYLPLDPAQPAARLNSILSDAQPLLQVGAVTDVALAGVSPFSWAQLSSHTAALQPVAVNPQSLAYVLYTSGSTGQPKGVQVSHASLQHYCQAAISALQLPAAGHYGLVSSLMADLGNTMLFPAWLQGGCLHLIGRDASTDSQLLRNYLQTYLPAGQLDCLKIVPSHLAALLSDEAAQALLPRQLLVLGGERISASLQAQLHPAQARGMRLYNHYGPTETTVGVLWRQLQPGSTDSALAAALGGNRVYLLDSQLRPAVSGQVAELYLAGPGLSRGYLQAPERTAEVCLPDPFLNDGSRIYRSGDLALRRADGTVEIVGRADQQVKIRGFRLELEEVEAVLARHDQVQQAAVLLQGSGDQAQLLAFVVATRGQQPGEALLRQWLGQQLPDYMVPAQLMRVPSLPLNANGKVDNAALLTLASNARQRQYVAPASALEVQLAEVWQAVLEQPQISVTDNFFELGGHSLAAIKVVARLRQLLTRELPTTLLFEQQSIRALAQWLEGDTASGRLLQLSDNPDAPTMVVMHASGGHLRYYQPLLTALKDSHSLYGLLPDPALLTGTGPEVLDQVLADYQALLAPLKDQPLILTGWSLAARQMMMLAQRLQENGFLIQAVAVIDYDPHQHLEHQHDERHQLQLDLQHYLQQQQLNFSAQQWQQLQDLLADDYASGVARLLDSPLLAPVLGPELSRDELQQQLLLRWQLKTLFYAHPIPTLSVPLWVWRSDENKAPVEAWQSFSQQPILGGSIRADHYSILAAPALAVQLQALSTRLDEMQ